MKKSARDARRKKHRQTCRRIVRYCLRVTLTLKDPTIPTSIKLSPSGPTVGKVGDSVRLVASLPTGTNSGIKWSSSNKRVATVSNGVVVFKKPGKAVITATCVRGKKKASIKVVVTRQ